MNKTLYITEKPSVAMEFAKVLKINGQRRNGYLEAENAVVTWCVGHLVTMSYPDAYDEALKKWSLNTLPFLPKEYKYEVIPAVKNQFEVIQQLLHRSDITTIYVCTDSGREGEYIYRLVDLMVGVEGKEKRRVWIDSQTEEEITRGIKEAKLLSEYDPLGNSAFLRAKEDYLAGINFSRLLTLIFGKVIAQKLEKDHVVVAVGRVMTCVLGMVVDREREVRDFVKTPFYKIQGTFSKNNESEYIGEWKAVEESKYFMSPLLFNDNGFKEKKDAEKLVEDLIGGNAPEKAKIANVKKSKEKKYAPLLFNLAELQNECTKKYKISPDETLSAVQTLYEKKMVTYPRTDARVLSNAVAKEINVNLKGLTGFQGNTLVREGATKVLQNQWIKNLKSSKYVNDDKITDHYAIIPTGKGMENYNRLKEIEKKIFALITFRFLAIFYPPAEYQKITVLTELKGEFFQTNQKVCVVQGYLEILKPDTEDKDKTSSEEDQFLNTLRKGQQIDVKGLEIKEGETSPPKRYTSGSIILAMENAGKLIEDEELREQIKGSGIGTSATRAEIIKKLIRIEYIDSNDKTQVLTPTPLGELIYIVVKKSIPDLLNPKLTASWEKGLEMVAKRELECDEYMEKLEKYIKNKVNKVLVKKHTSR